MFARNAFSKLARAAPRAAFAVQTSKAKLSTPARQPARFFSQLNPPRPDDAVPSDVAYKQVTPVANPHLKELSTDFLYHLGLSTDDDLKGLFNDVKFLCIGGSADRIEHFANRALAALGPNGADLLDIPNYIQKVHPLGKTERFSLYVPPCDFPRFSRGLLDWARQI